MVARSQHEAVEAGRPYQQLQDAGMQTARLDGVMRHDRHKGNESSSNTLPVVEGNQT